MGKCLLLMPSSRLLQTSMISLFKWGSSDPKKIKHCFLWGQNIQRLKERKRIKRINLMLQILKKRTSRKKSLPARRNTRKKETKAKRKSNVPIAGRDSTLNIPAWRRIFMRWILSLREIISIFLRVFEREIINIGIPNKKQDMLSWKTPRSPKICS